jgi:tetratricopeptide (TPR) repeat protein
VTNLQRGEIELARRRFTEVAERERPGSEAHASALLNIGELEFAVGNVAAARAAARQARETFERLNAAPLGLAVCNLAAYAMAVDELDEASELLQEALDILKQTGARWTITALEHHALLAALRGDHDRAATLLGFTEAHYAKGDTRQTTERIGKDRLTELLHREFKDDDLARRMRLGAWLNDEQALEHAAAINNLRVLHSAIAAKGKKSHEQRSRTSYRRP